MNKNLNISIPKPCSEKWASFLPTPDGGFCSSCSKVVVDFTKMGDTEIVDFFKTKSAHTCGRFRADQLKSYPPTINAKINPGFTLLKASFLSLVFVLVGRQGSAQSTVQKSKVEVAQYPEHSVTTSDTTKSPGVILSGVVLDSQDKSALAGVNVVLKGSTQGTVTDADGKFEFPKALQEGDILVFTFIGLTTKEHIVNNRDISRLEIPMQLCLDYDMTGEVVVVGGLVETESRVSRFWSKVKNLF